MKVHVICIATDDREVSEDIRLEMVKLGKLLNTMFPDTTIVYKQFDANLTDLIVSQPLASMTLPTKKHPKS